MKKKKLPVEALWLVGVIITIVIAGFVLNSYAKSDGRFVPAEKQGLEKAPELEGIHSYINTDEIRVSGLKGKVVLVDFWTYTCINCIRTLPYLNDWNAKYSDAGLQIIGVHTPEFKFEKEHSNVQAAVEKYGINYPVALDNDYRTWRAYRNSYWPRKYLVDVDGYIRYEHIGEGAYEETEKVIQSLLKERAERLKKDFVERNLSRPGSAIPVDFSSVATPELYFGYQFMRQPLGNPEGVVPGGTVSYTMPLAEAKPNYVYLSGTWKNNADSMELVSDEGQMILGYTAGAVNIVAGSEAGSSVDVSVDGKPLSANRGFDTNESIALIKSYKLYNLVFADYGQHMLLLSVKGSGFKIYTFTFG